MLRIKWQKGRQPRRLLCFSAAFFLMALTFTLLLARAAHIPAAMLLTGAVAMLLCAGLTLLLREETYRFRALLLGLVAGWLWCCGYGCAALLPAQKLDGFAGTLRVELTDYAESHISYGTAEGILTQADGVACRRRVKLYLLDGTPEGAPGDVLTFQGTLHAASRDWRTGLLPRGLLLTVSQEGPEILEPGAAMTALRRMRVFSRRMAQRIGTLLPGDEGTLLSALLCGQKAPSGSELERALTLSGTRHITAVSGLHVSILAGAMIWLLGKKRGLLLAIPVVFCYGAIVGFPASVVRAGVMLLFWAGSFWLKEEKDPLTALAAALLLLTAQDPFSCLSPGLLLSFGATLGLILLAGPLQRAFTAPLNKLSRPWLRKLLFYIASTAASSLAATLFTLPLNLLFFETVPLLSLLYNILILWAVALGMELGILTLVISLISMPAAALFARWVARWPLWWVVTAVKSALGLRFAATDSANLFLAVFSGLILLVLLLWKGERLSSRKTLLAAGALLSAAVMLTAAERAVFGTLQIVNSGGQAVLLLRGEEVCVINAGARRETAGEALAEAMTRWNAAETGLVLCTGEGYKSQGGLLPLLEEAHPQTLLLPSASGALPGEYEVYGARYYKKTGAVKCGDFTAELVQLSDKSYLCRLLGQRSSVLLAAGLKKKPLLEALQQQDCRADILILDGGQAQDFRVLYRLFAAAQPRQIYCISGSYDSDLPERCCGVLIRRVGSKGAAISYMR